MRSNIFLTAEGESGFNVEQIQVLNAIPTYNVYGQTANNAEFDFKNIEKAGVYGCGTIWIIL